MFEWTSGLGLRLNYIADDVIDDALAFWNNFFSLNKGLVKTYQFHFVLFFCE